ncbi:MAG TPA: hypothetical protein VJO52_02665 [Gemmatimonadaceae bacterium]|nr:hypothetical protein [Gemmatimonadaceae bacterium]
MTKTPRVTDCRVEGGAQRTVTQDTTMFRTRIVIALAAALAAGVTPLGAQQASGGLAAAGPTLAAASLSPQLAEQPATAPYSNSSNFALSNGEKLMVLGGAALITGAIIGDTPGTIIMIGGGAFLLYGLYVQLGRPHSGEPTDIGYAVKF